MKQKHNLNLKRISDKQWEETKIDKQERSSSHPIEVYQPPNKKSDEQDFTPVSLTRELRSTSMNKFKQGRYSIETNSYVIEKNSHYTMLDRLTNTVKNGRAFGRKRSQQ